MRLDFFGQLCYNTDYNGLMGYSTMMKSPQATIPVSEVKAGDKLMADDGFTCLAHLEVVTVQEHELGLFVPCSEGKHFLSAQVEGDQLVGFSKQGTST